MTNALKKYIPTLFIVCVSFLARLLSPVIYIFNTPHDDLLAVEQAGHILDGEWLGQWSNRTLAKPPGYAFFLVLSHVISIRPEWLLWGIVVIASFYLRWVLCKIMNIQGEVKKFFILAILVLNPTLYAADFSRLYRTSLYTVLALMFSAILLHLCFELLKKTRPENVDVLVPKTFKLFVALGATYGMMSITRTEGLWVFIPFLTTLFFILIKLVRQSKGKARISQISTIGSGLIAMILFSLIPSTLISSTNLQNYGVETLENFYSGSFAEAMKSWQSVIPDEKYPPNISITKSMREKVYAISPSARSLKDFLEAPPNTGWKVFNCDRGYPCDESGSWIPWEIRDATVVSNQIQSENAFNDFFAQLNLEIQAGCNSKKIACRSPGMAPMLINIRYLSLESILSKSLYYLSTYPKMHQARFAAPIDSEYTPELLNTWSKAVKVKLYDGKNHNAENIALKVLSSFKFVYVVFVLSSLIVLLLVLSIGFMTRKRNSVLEFSIFYLFFSILLFCGGLALLEIALGYNPGDWLYGLPAQPLVLMLSILGFFSFDKSTKKILMEFVRKTD